MFDKITAVACFIGLVRSGAIHNAASNLGRYGNLAAYGGYNELAGNLGYGAHGLGGNLYGANGKAGNLGYGANGLAGNLGNGANPALGGATSYVNIVKEISNRGAYGNGGYPGVNGAYLGVNSAYAGVNGYNSLAGYGAAGYNGAAGWPNLGYASLVGAGLPYAGGLGTYVGAGSNNRNLGYVSGYPYGGGYSGAAGYPYAAGNPLAGAAGYGGIPTSYSNVYNGPLRSPLLGNGAHGAGAAGYGGYGYGNGQAW